MSSLTQQIYALGLGLCGGLVAWGIGMPLAWMLGPMVACTIGALARLPVKSPMRLRPFVIPVIGVLLGSRISADVIADAADWWPAFALLLPFLVVTAGVSYVYFRRLGRYDRPTAYFAAMPGGLTDMIIAGTEVGGDERRISLAHATRILIVVIGVVLFYGAFLGVSQEETARGWVGLNALTVMDWLLLALCAAIGAPLGAWLRLPAAAIMGPMVLSGILHMTEVVTVAPPNLVVIVSLVVMGTTIGCRFAGADLREVGRDLGLGAGSAVLMIGLAVGFAVLAGWSVGLPVSAAFLAYAPGGLTEMSLLALAIGQDVTFVTVMHLARIIAVVFGAGFLYRG